VWCIIFIRDHPVEGIIDPLIVPHEEREELLKRTDWYARREGNRFDALAFDFGHQARNVE